MLESRIIPVLGILGKGLYKTKCFEHPKYVGDPLNAVHVFNEKGVNELFVSSFRCSLDHEPIPHGLLKELAGEAFFPLGYSGGLNNIAECVKIISYGFEKVCLNSAAFTDPELISDIAKELGSSSVVVSIDIRKDPATGDYRVFTHSGTRDTGLTLEQAAMQSINAGAGELLIHHIDLDGTYSGYDFNAVQLLKDKVNVPVIILGGAREMSDIAEAKKANIQGIAASSIFVFYGKLKSVLINYPENSLTKC